MPRSHLVSLPELTQLYIGERDVSFAEVLSRTGIAGEDRLAELIEADGRVRLARKLPVELSRYLRALPGLLLQPDALDAAIDVALRSLAGGSRITPVAVRSLSQQHPELTAQIEEAAALNAAIWSTTGLRSRVAPPPAKPLPCEFGPKLPSGERRYILKQLLGQGAFGQVYLAWDRQLSEADHSALVAIKLLPGSSQTSAARQRIIDEAVKVRRISHPNVVQVLDRGSTEFDEDFIVYEFVDGGDLGEALPSVAGQSIRAAAQMISKISRGVHAAHSAGVIHCDLKPGNIMLSTSGEPKVADFGIAVRLGKPGSDHQLGVGDEGHERIGPVGNIAFISPEQYRGGDQAFSIPSDIYALGGMLFMLLTNQLPNGDTFESIEQTHDPVSGRQSPPSPRELRPEIDRDLDAICRRAMAQSPEDRHPSAAALAEDLEHWLAHEPISWLRPGALRTARLWARRKPALAGALVTIVVLAVAGTAVSLWMRAIANKRSMDAAFTQLQLEEKDRREAETVSLVRRVIAALRANASDYRLNTEALVQIWVFEYAFGPTVLGIPDARSELWGGRIANIRRLVEQAREQNRENELEPMMWESALGFWLTCDHDYQEAEPLLAANLQRWEQWLSPEDDWLGTLRAMADCASANRLIHTATGAPIDQRHVQELAELSQRLAQFGQAMRADHRGTPIHLLILTRLMELHEPNLLNQPEQHKALEAEIAELAKSKRGRPLAG